MMVGKFPYGGGPTSDPDDESAEGDELSEQDDLDFDEGFLSTDAPHAHRVAGKAIGVSAAKHLKTRTFIYPGWRCECKATAKSGIPPRHVMQFIDGEPVVMILGREIHQGKGGNVTDADEVDESKTAPCPTASPEMIVWNRPRRDWSKLILGWSPPVEPNPDPKYKKGPIGNAEELSVADLKPRSTAKSILESELCSLALKIRGRIVDDGPIVEQYMLIGVTADGEKWAAFWQDGKFWRGNIDGRQAKLNDIRNAIRE